MKNILTIIAVALTINATAQKAEKVFTIDTVQGAESIYFSYASKVKTNDGIVGFSLVKEDIADSLSSLVMQGAMTSDYSDAIDLTGNAVLSETSTDGASFLYEESPKYLYYRLKATCASGDTVAFSSIKFIYK